VLCIALLCLVTTWAVFVARKKGKDGVVLSSWGGMVCIIVLVSVYMYFLDGRDFPFLLALLPFGVLGLGTVCGYACSIAYTAISISICITSGIVCREVGQAMGVSMSVMVAFFLGNMFNSLLHEQTELRTESVMFRELLETIINAKRDKPSGRTEDAVSKRFISNDR
jgi:hypothetical protein